MIFFGWVFYCQPCEKALPEIDKRLNVELELRKLARKEGRRYCDPVALTYQSERMPEPLRSKVGQVPTVQVQAALLFSFFQWLSSRNYGFSYFLARWLGSGIREAQNNF